MIKALLRPLGWIPLRWTHAVGALLGRIVYLCSPVYASRLRENLRQSGLATEPRAFERLLRSSIGEAGKSFSEILAIWARDEGAAARLVVDCPDQALALELHGRGKGVIFLTPHLVP